MKREEGEGEREEGEGGSQHTRATLLSISILNSRLLNIGMSGLYPNETSWNYKINQQGRGRGRGRGREGGGSKG